MSRQYSPEHIMTFQPEPDIDLNVHLIDNPIATYYARACGESMTGAGIMSGDLLIGDRSLEVKHMDVVIVALDGQLTCKYIDLNEHALLAANPNYPPIPIPDELDVIIEGVVIHSVHHFRPGAYPHQ